MKKYLLCAALLLVVSAFFTGCGKTYDEDPSAGNPTSLFAAVTRDATLPVISVTTGTAGDVLTKNFEPVTVTISGAGLDEYNVSGLSAEMKRHGNSTFGFDKGSYRIKFTKKIDLFGQGKGPAKSWVLLSNHSDKSLLRNHTALAMASKLSFGFVTSSSFVDLYLNGEYRGVYQLVEHHQTGKYRVVAHEDPVKPDTDYFVELDGWGARSDKEGDLDVFKVEEEGDLKPDRFVVHSDTMTEEKLDFIRTFFTGARNAIRDGDREEIERYIDVASFVDMYILQEFTENVDVGWSSIFFLKKAGGVIYCTCPWDFDLTMGNDIRLAENTGELIYVADPETVYGELARDEKKDLHGSKWFVDLMSRRWFVDLVRERWGEKRDELYETMIGEIDRIYGYFGDRMNENFKVWDIMGKRVCIEPKALLEIRDYKGQVDYLKKWVGTKFNYLDGYFSDPERCYSTVKD